ncbi:hypothetical protein JXR93_08755 [bacterium]|nr:hypothetical protein [bacterium]
MIEKKYDSRGLLLIVKQHSTVSLDDMLKGVDFLENSTDLPKELRIIEDARDIELSFNVDDLDILIDKIKKVAIKYSLIKHSVIHNSPINTAYTMILSSKTLSNNYNLQVFSTIDAALKWLNSDLSDADCF